MLEEKYSSFAFNRSGRILRVTLNRPDRLNAMAGDMHREISYLFIDLANDPDSDIIVLTGAGKAFSAGGDLDYLEACHADPTLFHGALQEARRLINSLLDCDKPIICRMNGDAIGLGATIALFCDVVIAVETARIGDPHVLAGLVAGDGGAVIWPQLVGFTRAKQYLLSGELMTATEAERIGLINFAVPADELDACVNEWAGKLSRAPKLAARWTKATINAGLKHLAGPVLETGLAYEGMSNTTADHAEAIAAMREKRKPRFSGR